MSGVGIFTLITALVGAILGVINTIHELNRDKIKLLVKPVWLIPTYGPVLGTNVMGIEVINLSLIPVTVEEVGFYLSDGNKIIPIQPWITDGGPYPRRLEPRTSFTVAFEENLLKKPEFKKAECAFAKTACSMKFKGTSPAFKDALVKAKSLS